MVYLGGKVLPCSQAAFVAGRIKRRKDDACEESYDSDNNKKLYEGKGPTDHFFILS
jgi:hypothetical protein